MEFSTNGDSSSEAIQAQTHLYNQTFKFISSMSLKCAVQLGIPDAIHGHGGSMTLSQLVDALAIRPQKAPHLGRLMRFLKTQGLFKIENVQEEDRYLLTPSSSMLLKDHPYTMRPLVLMLLDPVLTTPWHFMSQCFRNDDPMAFVSAHGVTIWEYGAKDDRVNDLINDGMSSDTQLISSIVVGKLKDMFEGVNTLVDIGGGTGTMAKAIAKAFPDLECICFDLPQVVSSLKDCGNLKFVGGDMFEEVPSADAILLKWILHDWNDEECVKILLQCKAALERKGKGGMLIIVEMVVGGKELEMEEAEAQLQMDMEMMVMATGRERGEKEWAKLFSEAGFSSHKIHPIVGIRAVIEVYP